MLGTRPSFPEAAYWYAEKQPSRCCFCCRKLGDPNYMGNNGFCVRMKTNFFQNLFSKSASKYMIIKKNEFKADKHVSTLNGNVGNDYCCLESDGHAILTNSTYIQSRDKFLPVSGDHHSVISNKNKKKKWF